MTNDPILEELHQFREAFVKKFNYDLEAMAAYLREQEKVSGRKLVSFPPRKPVQQPKYRPAIYQVAAMAD